jgi:hypothetical protein
VISLAYAAVCFQKIHMKASSALAYGNEVTQATISWKKIFHEAVKGIPHLFWKPFLIFSGSQRFIITFARVRHWAPP